MHTFTDENNVTLEVTLIVADFNSWSLTKVPMVVLVMFADFKMEHRTGKAVKLRQVPQNKMNAVLSGVFHDESLPSSLMSVHHKENTAPVPKANAIEVTEKQNPVRYDERKG